MHLHPIKTVEDLQFYVATAIQLEHATIPPYLTAMYSIHPGTNKDAYDVMRVVAIEEMLHLTLAANLMNAIGGTPDLTQKGFVPSYPTYLPNGETDFEVGLGKFSLETIDTFLNIERPPLPTNSKKNNATSNLGLLKTQRTKKMLIPTFKSAEGDELHFYSIGEFYKAIGEGITKLTEELGEKNVFVGDPDKQITPEYYYSGGGEIIPIHNKKSALAAIRLISEQGEGHEGGIFDYEGELSHYYRFQQIKLGKYYHKGDEPNDPSGESMPIDWDAVYPIQSNPRIEDFENVLELKKAAIDFNLFYKNFLKQLTNSFNGKPDQLISAVGGMFRIKEMSYQLMRNPINEKEKTTGAPTFEIDLV
ncbi:ferritin-like domain-containing protein [Aquimarina pacifica]|uniref:ferritin-like domain-containing protein n=1 Tax=Aquimarina pacifica TaxID=1296415 RepID=UPI00046FD696|nr:ferritin-like protein [Aquimarina pacifica]